MQITRLRLVGFKSFVEPADLLIAPGLTGVVGPNGCGKSNLLEALRWVMGETSYKSMRGSAMEDVIFSGTQNRPARNMAEVAITLDNAERTATPAFNDDDTLEITRKIVRDSGSLYRINGQDVRARDVQLLFADQATGAHSPALVQQGRIGELVNAKPQSRRRILEEAAGITGLHTRRHEAELRLNGATGNLERLADIMGQMQSQLENLKRQARQARRYKDINAKIRTSQTLIFWAKFHALEQDLAGETADLHEITALVGALTATESSSRRAMEQTEQTLAPLRREEAIAAALLQRLKTENQTLEAEAKRSADRLAEIGRQIGQSQTDLFRETNLQHEADVFAEKLADENKTLTQEDDHTEQASLRQNADAAKAELHSAEALLHSLMSELSDLRARRTMHAQQIARTAAHIKRLDDELFGIAAKLETEPATPPADLPVLQEKIETQKTALEAQLKATEDAEQTHGTLNAQLAEARQTHDDARLAASRLDTETKTLQTLLGGAGDDTAALANQVSVTPGYEAALAAALQDDLEASLDDQALVHWLAVPRTEASPLAPSLPPLPRGVKPLKDVVDAPARLQARLAMTGIVADDSEAPINQLMPGQRLVNQRGDLWRWDGFVARADAPTNAAKRLKQRNRLKQLLLALEQARLSESKGAQTLQTAQNRLTQTEQQQKSRRARIAQIRTALDQDHKELAKKQQLLQAEQAKHAALVDAKSRVDDTLTTHRAELKTATEAQAALPPFAQLEARQQALTADLGEKRARLTETTAALQTLQGRIDARTKRQAAIATEQAFWQNRIETSQTQIKSLEKRGQDLAQEHETLAQKPEQIKAARQKLHARLSADEARRKSAADALAAAENQIHDQSKALATAQTDLAQAREKRAAVTARVEAATDRIEALAADINDALNCAPDKLLAGAGIENAEQVPDLKNLEDTVQKLKSARDRLGSVNLMADEEQAELGQKLDDMTTESENLEQAIAKLRGSIQSLNAEGRKRLLSAFEKVNDHFKHLFTSLFGGGNARLDLIASDDPLEAGLEIIASPPGKKPQVLSLLSGGEKALTALSLIFAVFLTNPAPICVLDEVDAPLDDANVERFCNLLEEMRKSTDTRFLVITHHPMTMARMNRLFGVTMIERGISQLVSVDLEEAERLRDTA